MNHIRTWQFNLNNTTSGNTSAELLLALKNAYKGFASNPWTIVSSSNSIGTINDDGWTTTGDLVWAAGSHSWIVLYQAALGLYMLWDCSTANQTELTVKLSFEQFTGGTTGTAPTANNSTTVLNAASWGWSNTNSSTSTWSVMHSTDGYGTRSIVWRDTSNVYTHLWNFDLLENNFVSISNPVTARLISTGSVNCLTRANLIETENFKIYDNTHSQWANALPSFEGQGTDLYFETAACFNELTQEFEIPKIGLFSKTSNSRGKIGTIIDYYAMHSGFQTTGTLFDEGKWLYLSNILIPWDNSTPSQP